MSRNLGDGIRSQLRASITGPGCRLYRMGCRRDRLTVRPLLYQHQQIHQSNGTRYALITLRVHI